MDFTESFKLLSLTLEFSMHSLIFYVGRTSEERCMRSHARVYQIFIRKVRRRAVAVNPTVADTIVDRSVETPISCREKKRNLLRTFQQNQGFVTECVDAETAQGFILAKFHGYCNGLTFRFGV